MISSDIKEISSYIDLTLILETTPGRAAFEATVRRWTGGNSVNKNEIMGSVSRINLYGNQSCCIDDYHLKMYCFCTWQNSCESVI